MPDEIVTAPIPPAKPARIIDRIGVPEIVDLTLVFGMLAIIFCWIMFKPDPNNQLLTSLITAWASMTAVIVSYHRGASKTTTSTQLAHPPEPPPVSPWWSRLTDAEKAAITTAASNDARIAAFVTTSSAGHGASDDLAYLVSKNLLTADRAAAIKGA